MENLPADIELAEQPQPKLITEKELEDKLAEVTKIADAWKDEEARFKREGDDHKAELDNLKKEFANLKPDSQEAATIRLKVKEQETAIKATETKRAEAAQKPQQAKAAVTYAQKKSKELAEKKAGASAGVKKNAKELAEKKAGEEGKGKGREEPRPENVTAEARREELEEAEERAKKQAKRIALLAAEKAAENEEKLAAQKAKLAKIKRDELQKELDEFKKQEGDDESDSSSGSARRPGGTEKAINIDDGDDGVSPTNNPETRSGPKLDKIQEAQGLRIKQVERRTEDIEHELCRRSLTISELPEWRQSWEIDEKPNTPDKKVVENQVWQLLKTVWPRAGQSIEELRMICGEWRAKILFRQAEKAKKMRSDWALCASEVPDSLFILGKRLQLMQSRTRGDEAVYRLIRYILALITKIYGDRRPRRWQLAVREIHIAVKIRGADGKFREKAKPLAKFDVMRGTSLKVHVVDSLLLEAGRIWNVPEENRSGPYLASLLEEKFQKEQEAWSGEEIKISFEAIHTADEEAEKIFKQNRAKLMQPDPSWLSEGETKKPQKKESEEDATAEAEILDNEYEATAKRKAENEIIEAEGKKKAQKTAKKRAATTRTKLSEEEEMDVEEFGAGDLYEENGEEDDEAEANGEEDEWEAATSREAKKSRAIAARTRTMPPWKQGAARDAKGFKGAGRGKGKNKGKGKGKGKGGKDKNKGKGKGKFKGLCRICEKPGHKAAECWHG